MNNFFENEPSHVSEVEMVQEFKPLELDLGLVEHEIPNPVKRPPKIKLSQIRRKMVKINDLK
jgi:hypothetical protein